MSTDHTFYIKEGDRLPVIDEFLMYDDGTPIDLSSASSVKFIMRLRGSTGSPKITNSANVTIVSATQGRVQYAWGASDTDTPGEYAREWVVTIGGKDLTVPNNDSYTVVVLEDEE